MSAQILQDQHDFCSIELDLLQFQALLAPDLIVQLTCSLCARNSGKRSTIS